MTTHQIPPEKPYRGAKLTIRIYRVRPDGARDPVSACFSDEEEVLPLVSALSWPACACPRCTAAASVGASVGAA
ncbi:hypothetical protein HUT16_16235 [Kitasatospora sp. NA04385]|uniref:hypothetical protein n=1 Tax=Kitasatospora sp. NA04385 TaxID=2742135 RepID=UPI0015923F4F|nr:hypothetical protein [Kitasatospora sp. NA04385]QKW20409.1 hypothetical protein HUT16_16235 [Kitasatospora sp. NA04385]